MQPAHRVDERPLRRLDGLRRRLAVERRLLLWRQRGRQLRHAAASPARPSALGGGPSVSGGHKVLPVEAAVRVSRPYARPRTWRLFHASRQDERPLLLADQRAEERLAETVGVGDSRPAHEMDVIEVDSRKRLRWRRRLQAEFVSELCDVVGTSLFAGVTAYDPSEGGLSALVVIAVEPGDQLVGGRTRHPCRSDTGDQLRSTTHRLGHGSANTTCRATFRRWRRRRRWPRVDASTPPPPVVRAAGHRKRGDATCGGPPRRLIEIDAETAVHRFRPRSSL